MSTYMDEGVRRGIEEARALAQQNADYLDKQIAKADRELERLTTSLSEMREERKKNLRTVVEADSLLASPPAGEAPAPLIRLVAELLADGQAEVVGLKSLRGYSPTYVEIDGVPVEWPQPDRREQSGVRVRRANGEIALYLTTTVERARLLLSEAQRLAVLAAPPEGKKPSRLR